MKLNVGSRDFTGIYRDEEWLNIDLEPHPKMPSNFMIMDVFKMPDEWLNKFEEIHAVHVLEHVNRNLRQDFVDACYRVTAPRGLCYIEVPDFQATVCNLNDAFLRGDTRMQHIWTTSIYGKQRSPGDQHCWGYTKATLKDLMVRAGFKDVEVACNVDSNLQPISTHFKQEPVLLTRGTK